MTRWFTILAAMALSGCTTMQTRHAVAAGPISEGASYFLPEGEFKLTVTQTGGALTVSVGGAENVPDRSAPLDSRLPRNGTSDDNVTITLEETAPLLSRVEITSTGRVTQIAEAAARSFGPMQATDTPLSAEPIFEGRFTLRNYGAVVSEANRRLRLYFEDKCPPDLRANTGPFAPALARTGYTPEMENPGLQERLLICRQLAAAGLSANSTNSTNKIIDITVDTETATALNTAEVTDFDQCARGVCHRPLMPVRLTLSVGRYYSKTDTFMVPDRSRLMFIDLRAGIFAQQRYTVTFNNGVLNSYNQNAQSELVGLFSLPGDIVAGVLKAQAEALGLRQSTLAAETSYLNAVRTNVEAQQQTAQTCSANATACPGTAYRVMRITVPRPAQPASSGAGNGQSGGSGSGSGSGSDNSGDKVPEDDG